MLQPLPLHFRQRVPAVQDRAWHLQPAALSRYAMRPMSEQLPQCTSHGCPDSHPAHVRNLLCMKNGSQYGQCASRPPKPRNKCPYQRQKIGTMLYPLLSYYSSQQARRQDHDKNSTSLYTGAATAWRPCSQSVGELTLCASTTAQPAVAAALSVAHFHCCQQQQDHRL
jgi:hypothetical protein